MWADGIASALAFCAIIILFYGPWQDACTDLARHAIFKRRDQLFDMAHAGELDFEDENYQTIRQGLELFIRYAHTLSWPRYALSYLLDPRLEKASDDTFAFRRAINTIEDETTRKIVKNLVNESTFHLIVMMALKSIVIAPLVLLLLGAAMITRTFMTIKDHLQFIEQVTLNITNSASLAERGPRGNRALPT